MKIIIIGLGLIVGSIAKSLSNSKNHEILAFDIDQSSIKDALDNKSIVGSINTLDDLGNAEFDDSLVIISTPPNVTVEVLQSLDFYLIPQLPLQKHQALKSSLNKIIQEFNFQKILSFSSRS